MKRPKYKVIQVEELVRVVKEICKNHKEIQLAYLYGSYARGNQTEFSDLDIGVVLERKFKEKPLYFASIASQIEKEFNYLINIDLRVLNYATPRFLFQVIKNCKVLYARNETFMHEFELIVLYQYQDIKPMLDMYDRMNITEVLDDGY